METFNAISKRASVRDYQKKTIPKNLLEQLVDAGRRAPSARAVEPWEFIVVTQKEMLQKLGAMISTGRFIADAGACIAIFSKETKYYLEDGCAATENILIAAADLSLGCCWVAGDKKDYCPDVVQILGVPENIKLISLISIGWPTTNVTQSKTRSLQDVIHWEKY